MQVKDSRPRTAAKSVYVIAIDRKTVVKVYPNIFAAVDAIYEAANPEELRKFQIENRIRHAIQKGKEQFCLYWSWTREVAEPKPKKQWYL